MTEDDVRVLLDGYEAWNRGEFEVLAELLDPEIEWEPGFGALEAGVHRGARGFREFVDSWLESFDDFRIQPELLLQAGDRTIVVAQQRGRGRGSGVELETKVVHVWTIRDGQASRWWGPRTLDEALEALGDPRLATTLRAYEAFNRGELDAAISAFDPDIVWNTYLVPGPGGGTYNGHDGVRELWSDVRHILEDFQNLPERLIATDDGVVVFVRFCGRGRESGVQVEAKIAHVFTFKGETAVRVDSVEDRDEALRVAGIA